MQPLPSNPCMLLRVRVCGPCTRRGLMPALYQPGDMTYPAPKSSCNGYEPANQVEAAKYRCPGIRPLISSSTAPRRQTTGDCVGCRPIVGPYSVAYPVLGALASCPGNCRGLGLVDEMAVTECDWFVGPLSSCRAVRFQGGLEGRGQQRSVRVTISRRQYRQLFLGPSAGVVPYAGML